jgi:uncharacterized membrane protein
MADPKPMVVLVATYPNVTDAESDYKAVMALHKEGDLGHVAAAVLTKDDEGKLKIHRHDTTAKHLAWGGLIVGAFIGVMLPWLGAVFIMGSFLGGAALSAGVDGAVLAGFGGLTGHFFEQIPKDDLRQMGDLLESGDAGLVVVGVDKKQEEVEAVLAKADRKIVRKLDDGNVDAAYKESLEAASKIEKIEA